MLLAEAAAMMRIPGLLDGRATKVGEEVFLNKRGCG